MLKETEGNECKSLQLLTITFISLSMPLKKLLAYTPNFRIQTNTARLPTSAVFLHALRTSSGGGFLR